MNDYHIKAKGNGYETPPSIAVSPDGSRLYVADIANNRVLVLAVEAGVNSNKARRRP